MNRSGGGDRPGPTGGMEMPPGIPVRLRDYVGPDQYEYGELAPLRMMGRAAFEAMLARPGMADVPQRVKRDLMDWDWEREDRERAEDFARLRAQGVIPPDTG